MLRFVPKSFVCLLTLAVFSTGALLNRAQADLTLYGSAFSSDPFDSNQNFSKLYNINYTNGAATFIGDIGYRLVGGLAFDANGTLYGVGETLTLGGPPPEGNLFLITINRTTGAGTAVGALGVQAQFQDIAFKNSNGQLYAYASGDLYNINKTSGAATLVGATGNPEIGTGLAFDLSDTLYSAGFDHLQSINPATGAGASVLQLSYPTGGTPNVTGMDYDYYSSPTAVLWAAVHTDATSYSPAYLAKIDTVTGLVTNIGFSVQGLTGLAAIPEPSNFGVLAGVGLVAIGMMSRVRRRTVVMV